MKTGILRCLALLLLVAAGCEVDPLSQRPVPKVGMVFISGSLNDEDIHTLDDIDDSDVTTESLAVDGVDPSSGAPAGGETVFVAGRGFQKGVEVWFDDAQSPDVFFVNSKKLRVVTPAHAIGFADIAVRWPGGKTKILPSGFLYKTDLAVKSVQPTLGPIAGGTPVTVTGSGFSDGLKLIFGRRAALDVVVVDETTVFAVTPPGESAGPADVFVSHLGAVAEGKGAFTYAVEPLLTHVEPAAGPTGGGQTARLLGKWLGPVTHVRFGDQDATIVAVESNSVTVTVPPGEEGPSDVLAAGTWGWSALAGGYLYFDPAAPASGVVAVIPADGPEAGGNLATVFGCDLVQGMVSAVRFGKSPAEIVGVHQDQCSLVVRVPPGKGNVTVEVDSGGKKFSKPSAYSYVPGPQVLEVQPDAGAASGGTHVHIFGQGFGPEAQILFGPMPAGSVKFVSPQELEAVTPPGSPGLVDVTVVSLSGTARLEDGFLYGVANPEVWLVTPNYGSQAGGTFVEVVGAGFHQGSKVRFCDLQATGVKAVGYGTLRVYTPPHLPGTCDVTVETPQGSAVLPFAYSYFDPTAWDGGTWGPSIDGAVNVTVFDAYQWEPLEGATVILGSNPETPFQGKTDPNGQVTLSGPGLAGPVDVHVTKPEHDAASVIRFDAENVTVYLIPFYPPSTGPPPDPPPSLLPGGVKGRVAGLGKYVVVPPGDCKNKKAAPGDLCSPCVEDSDCLSGAACLPLTKSGKYCSRPCTKDEDCGTGYMCAAAGTAGPHCTPSLGRRTAFCEISTTSIFQSMYDIKAKDEVDPDGKHWKYELTDTRLGEVAVICLGGYVDNDTGEFHALAMGVKRHVNVPPGTVVPDQNIWLNIPLTRTLRLRMDDPPTFKNFEGVYRVEAWLDFGSDGYFLLPGRFEGLVPEDIRLESMPVELSGDLYDTEYIFYSGAYTNVSDSTPYSIVYMAGIHEFTDSSVVTLEQDAFQPLAGAPAEVALYATAPGKQGEIVVGEKGKVFLAKGGAFYQLPSVTSENLNSVFGFPDGSLVAVGDNGVVVRYDGTKWDLAGSVTDMPLKSVWGSDPGDLIAVGHHRLATWYQGKWHVDLVSFDLTGVSGTGPDDVWVVGLGGQLLHGDGTGFSIKEQFTKDDLLAVRAFADGRVLAVGRGVAYLKTGSDWKSLGLAQGFVASSIFGESADDFHLAGAAGQVARYEKGIGFTYLDAPDNLQVYALFRDDLDRLVGVGTPALLLTPFIPFPRFQMPKDNGKQGECGAACPSGYLKWYYEGDDKPISLHTINITEKYGSSMWRFVVNGDVRQIALPPFHLILGYTPLTGEEKRLRIYSAYNPEFSIDFFDFYDLGTLSWTSWAYDMIAFDIAPEGTF
ncbi:MAG: hypothetical protein FJ109_04720 [Deltaproteobacteria bacterium]|nr:hypothetical protein [Deltaproteobacteria bacterium]